MYIDVNAMFRVGTISFEDDFFCFQDSKLCYVAQFIVRLILIGTLNLDKIRTIHNFLHVV